jgi:phenylacetate-coenzyme A ligase PaaK-like adenylate-forming protein
MVRADQNIEVVLTHLEKERHSLVRYSFSDIGDIEGFGRIEGLAVDDVVYIPLKCAY